MEKGVLPFLLVSFGSPCEGAGVKHAVSTFMRSPTCLQSFPELGFLCLQAVSWRLVQRMTLRSLYSEFPKAAALC